MQTRDAIKNPYAMVDYVWKAYINDLTDDDLLVRPVEGTNHIAWQLGHLIVSEHQMVEQTCPGSMPKLPDGFAEQYSKETAGTDDKSKFHSKQEYLQLADAQREATFAALDKLSDEQLDEPAPESLRSFCPTVASVFTMQPTHWMMHAGQWAIVRRKLGRPPLF